MFDQKRAGFGAGVGIGALLAFATRGLLIGGLRAKLGGDLKAGGDRE